MMYYSKATISVFFILVVISVDPTFAGKPHVINFRSPKLYPEGFTWDPSAQHFITGSLRQRSLHSVSDAGVVETLISDTSLPPNATILGVTVDPVNRRVFAAVHSMEPLPLFNALVSYDLRTRQRLSLTILDSSDSSDRPIANDVAVDYSGNAYVTNSAGNFIWKITPDGKSSVLSRSKIFTSFPIDDESPYSFCGLNGIAYAGNGYLLVVQSNTGKMYKVDADEGTAKQVLLSKDLTLADGISVRRDGVVVVVSTEKAWFLKSNDGWGEAVVYDEIALDANKTATSVAIREGDRAYVLYGHALEGVYGNGERDDFSIEEIESEEDSKEESIWIFVLIGLGLAYFTFWRFQMGQLVKHVNKKTN